MAALVELAVAVFAFILEMTFYALAFVVKLFQAIFSPRHRQHLINEWNTSHVSKLTMVLFFAVFSSITVLIFMFWSFILMPEPDSTPTKLESAANKLERSISNNISSSGLQMARESKPFSKFIDLASGLVKDEKDRQDEASHESDQVSDVSGLR